MATQDNNLLTDDVIAKEALRLLKNNLVAARLVFRQYEKTFGKVGDTIRLKLPFRVKSASGRTLVKQPMVDQTIPLVIDSQEHVGLEYTVKDKTLSITQFSERYLKSGMSQIANQIDRSVLLTLQQMFHSSGTPGTRPGAFIDFANAAAKQTTYAVPDDGLRRAVIQPFTCASLSDEVTKLFQNQMVKGAYQKGYKGPVAQYGTYESQNVPNHTVGDHTASTILTDGVTVNGNSISLKGLEVSTAGILLAGDVIYIAGMFGVNPQNYASTGLLQEFVLTADLPDSDAGGLAIATVSPAINDGTATILNEAGDTVSLKAYQNVSAQAIDGAAVSVIGLGNTTYEQNYLFHRDAIALAMIDLELPASAVVKSRASDPDSGLSLLLTAAYDINEQSEISRIDGVWGAKAIYPELGMRLWGAVV